MDAKVHVLPSVNRPDLEAPAPIDIVVQAVRDAGLATVAVVGRGLDGEVKVWSTGADADAVIGLLIRGVQFLTIGPQVQSPNGQDTG